MHVASSLRTISSRSGGLFLIPMAMGLPISLGSSIPFPMIPLSSVVMVSDAGVGITFMMMLIFNVTK